MPTPSVSRVASHPIESRLDAHTGLWTGGAAFALACILLQGRHLENDRKLLTPLASILESFVTWMTSRLQSSAARALAVVTPALTVMVIDRQSRVLLDNAGGIGTISLGAFALMIPNSILLGRLSLSTFEDSPSQYGHQADVGATSLRTLLLSLALVFRLQYRRKDPQSLASRRRRGRLGGFGGSSTSGKGGPTSFGRAAQPSRLSGRRGPSHRPHGQADDQWQGVST